MSENQTLRTTIVGGTIAALLASLLLEPVRAFLGSVWRVVTSALRAVWDVLTAPVPLWAVLAVAALAAFVMWVIRRPSTTTVEIYDDKKGTFVPLSDEDPEPVLSELEDAIMRRLARADGEWLAIEDLATAKTSQLRLDQALEHLENDLGLVEAHASQALGTVYGLTGRGRDLVIARGDV